MIFFNKEFENKIINANGIVGKKWLDSIEEMLDKYKGLLKLKNIKVLSNLNTNAIFEAYSDMYGEVIIKLIFKPKTFLNEINFINNCKSKYMVKCHYYNLEDQIIVLERIVPGNALNSIKDRTSRIKVFCDIMNDVMISEVDKNLYRDYFNSFSNKINNKDIIDNASDTIKDKIGKALQLYGILNKLELPKYVLHHDLHHNNILKSKDGWKVIDPQGVIDYSFFEFTQFIKSELHLENNDISKIPAIVKDLEKFIHYDVQLIYTALYIDTVEKILYYISIKEKEETINYNLKICDEVIKYIRIDNLNKL